MLINPTDSTYPESLSGFEINKENPSFCTNDDIITVRCFVMHHHCAMLCDAYRVLPP